jgi:small subunit ribosomal protein S3
MGQKVNPIGFRLGTNKTWKSKWFKESGYSTWLIEDQRLRTFIMNKLKKCGIADIKIERAASKCKIAIYSSKPGTIIGKKGSGIEHLKNKLLKLVNGDIFLDIREVKKPEIDAQLVAENIAQQLQRRIAFRRAMKKSISIAQKFGIEGVRISCSGRLGGAEMSRREWYKEGRVPLHTIRANIDYGFAEANTTYGKIGCKVWLFKGEILAKYQN